MAGRIHGRPSKWPAVEMVGRDYGRPEIPQAVDTQPLVLSDLLAVLASR